MRAAPKDYVPVRRARRQSATRWIPLLVAFGFGVLGALAATLALWRN